MEESEYILPLSISPTPCTIQPPATGHDQEEGQDQDQDKNPSCPINNSKLRNVELENMVTCAICCENFSCVVVKQEVEEVEVTPQPYDEEERPKPFVRKVVPCPLVKWTSEETNIFHWLVKWFHLKEPRKFLWCSEAGEAFPFCLKCKFELRSLLDLQLKLNELEKALESGIEEMRKKVEVSENCFISEGVYKKDARYKRLRSQIRSREKRSLRKPISRISVQVETEVKRDIDSSVSDTENDAGSESKLDSLESYIDFANNNSTPATTTSRSGRRVKPVLRYSPQSPEKWEDPLESPKVLLSVTDKEKADKYYSNPPKTPSQEKSNKRGRKKRKQSVSKVKICATSPPQKETNTVELPVEKLDRVENEISRKVKRKGGAAARPAAVKREGSGEDDADLVKPPGGIRSAEIPESEHDDDEEDYKPKRSITRKKSRKRVKSSDSQPAKQSVRKPGRPRNPNPNIKPKRKRVHKANHFCEICGKPCISKYSLERHQWSHLNQEEKDKTLAKGSIPKGVNELLRIWKCEECGVTFKRKQKLGRHQKVVHGSMEEREGFKELCPHCGQSYKDLKSHIKYTHKAQEKVYTCGICFKTYPTSRGRRIHKQTVHKQLSKVTCNLCKEPRGFSSLYAYNQHMNAHLDIRPYQCDKCPMAFTQNAVLQRHHKTYHEEGGNPRRNAYIRGRTKNAKLGTSRLVCAKKSKVSNKKELEVVEKEEKKQKGDGNEEVLQMEFEVQLDGESVPSLVLVSQITQPQ